MKRTWIIMITLVSLSALILLGNTSFGQVVNTGITNTESAPSRNNAYGANPERAGEVQVMAASAKATEDEKCMAQCCAKSQNPEAEMKQMKTDAAKDPNTADSMNRHNEARADSGKTETISGVYTCPMDSHSDVVQMGPGKCPKCGMKLVLVEKTSGRTFYICPMPQDSVVSSKPGTCPKCGMKLIEKTIGRESGKEMQADPTKSDKASDKEHLSGVYTCPMDSHANVIQMGPGKCPQCGMELVPVEKTSRRTFYVCPMPADEIVSSKPGNCPKCGMKLVQKSV